MAVDLFESEQAALVSVEEILADSPDWPGEATKALGDITRYYKTLLRQSRRTVRISDKTQHEIREAQKTITIQKQELEVLYEERNRQTEILEQTVKERTEHLVTSQNKLEQLIDKGIALASEHNKDRLMESILTSAMELANADGGTLYIRTEEDNLAFTIMRNTSLRIAKGGTTGELIDLPSIPLHDPKNGEPNHHNVATHSALDQTTVNIEDAYNDKSFDFSGTKAFDKQTGYRSQSFLTVPLMPRQGEVIGVLQLLNAQDLETGEVVAFAQENESIIEALAGQAAIALDNQNLLNAQKLLLEAFIEMIAGAIDAKSPYTGGHCNRVPELAKLLAEAACAEKTGPFAAFDMKEEDWYEFHIASWLHDCGKVTTPEFIVDKATKLETIYNRIHEIRTRFEVLLRDARITYLEKRLQGGDEAPLKTAMERDIEQLREDYTYVAEANVGGEFLDEDSKKRLREIGKRTWTRHLDDRRGLSQEELKRKEAQPTPELPVTERLFSDRYDHIVKREGDGNPFGDNPYNFHMDLPEQLYNYGELHNLCIERGTLTPEERYAINHHIIQTIIMLEQLPFPKHLARVPEYAGAHHETMIGTGYPKRLKKNDMSVPARIMAIADIFEALTASDRPYKKAKPLSEAIRIMAFMRNDKHIDADLFEVFLKSGAYNTYAENFLAPEQIDVVDIEAALGQK